MEITGLLYTQIGYDLGDPMRALMRSTDKSYVKEETVFVIYEMTTGEKVMKGNVKYWGDIWKSSWWVMDFSELTSPGEYKLSILQQGKVLTQSDVFKVGDHLLWDKTIQTVAIDQLEERARLARHGKGWKDCGSDWREVNSHATTVIGLCDLLNCGYKWLSADQVQRVSMQIMVGCDYIALCQDKAERLRFPKGAIIHEMPNHMIVIPGDVAQSAVAFARASRLLADIHPEKSDEYIQRGVDAYEFMLKKAEPYGSEGFSHENHGAPADFNVPKEWMTRDLLMMMWGGVELWASGKARYKTDVVRIAREVMNRQVPTEMNEDGLYGHFYTFQSCNFTEKANTHHHVGHDTGTSFPHYLLPFMDMLGRWYDHTDAPMWRETIQKFAYGYFLPACSRNPFYILPEGYFSGQGLLVFCGPWHGINTSLAFAATLASKLESFTGDKEFRKIATGNIQWIAGLNAGLTSESFNGFTLWKEQINPGEALPYSQIHGIGSRYVRCWTGIRGTIPNGFDVNTQFKFDVEPTAENDGPWLYTDEDWIPHSAGWMSALSALRDIKFYSF